jgi:uncharacterized membrane protein
MLDLGLSQPQAVGLMYLMALGVGSSALVAGPVGKITIMLGVAIAVTIILALVSYFRRKV